MARDVIHDMYFIVVQTYPAPHAPSEPQRSLITTRRREVPGTWSTAIILHPVTNPLLSGCPLVPVVVYPNNRYWGAPTTSRTPTKSCRLSGGYLYRAAARTSLTLLVHEPPRITGPASPSAFSCASSFWSVISNCMAITAGMPCCTRCCATPAKGSRRLLRRALTTVEQGQTQGRVILEQRTQTLAAHQKAQVVLVFQQQNTAVTLAIKATVADKVKNVILLATNWRCSARQRRLLQPGQLHQPARF